MLESEQNDFETYFCMTPAQFERLHRLVAPIIRKKTTRFREAIGTAERLAVTLRYLASSDMMVSMSFAFRISQTSVSRIIHETCKAISQVLRPTYLKPLESINWKGNAKWFNEVWNLPNCIGAIDGKHVVIECPWKSGSRHFNYKGTFSIVLLGVADADYRFPYVDIGAFGSQSDGGILHASTLGKAIYDGTFPFPADARLPGSEIVFPHYFVGDEAFPLRCHLLRPYTGRQLTHDLKVFNYRLSRARRVVECSFGILATWRVLRRPIKTSIASRAINIVAATVCLHNYIICCDAKSGKRNQYISPYMLDIEDPSTGNMALAEWRAEVTCNLTRIGQMGEYRPVKEAKQLRDIMRDYVINDYPLPWQDDYVDKV